MAKNVNKFLRVAAGMVVLVIVVLLPLGVLYHIISGRAYAIGALLGFGILILWTIIMQLPIAKISPGSSSEPQIPLDENARRITLYYLRMRGVWAGFLVVGLPCGIAYGLAHRAWLLTLGTVTINLLFMWEVVHDIRRLRKRLNSIQE